jgi:alpha-D-ribose 1-methylphosphonate 5-triphosphate synthase subunit PhnH
MVRETLYDEVLHSQQHFRSLLDSMSRPGKINPLNPVALTPPPNISRASALVAFALLNADVSFHLLNMTDADAAYLTANTRASVAPIQAAAFIFTNGDNSPGSLEGVNCGTLTYPDTAATIVIQVDALSRDPLMGGLRLTLEGPGIETTVCVYTRRLNPDLLLALQARNAEFPLGIDSILTCDDERGLPHVLGIPRTAKISWESC